MQTSPAFLYGESIFTSSRAKDGQLFFKDFHLERLFSGIENYYLGKELESDQKKALLEKIDNFLMDLEGSEEFRVRLTMFANPRNGILPDDFTFEDLNLSCEANKLSESQMPVSLKTYPSPFSLDYPNLKMGSYMPLLRLKLMARRSGADDALLLDNQGGVIESTTSNIVFYKGSELYTPKKRILNGTIIKSLKEEFNLIDQEIKLKDVKEFDGAFLTNSVNIITPVSKVDEVSYELDTDRPARIKDALLTRGYNEK
ncbi:MAG: hypothetical protein CME64_09770 [Halobacteriovoraceae bacterium]|nr:hypothetical protein [Halobacteriovoraceae bacterium]|tara:strand:+ start:45125 stop:45895 length:771 start_codon:yes stop_codon:yes gene_type:complete